MELPDLDCSELLVGSTFPLYNWYYISSSPLMPEEFFSTKTLLINYVK